MCCLPFNEGVALNLEFKNKSNYNKCLYVSLQMFSFASQLQNSKEINKPKNKSEKQS